MPPDCVRISATVDSTADSSLTSIARARERGERAADSLTVPAGLVGGESIGHRLPDAPSPHR
jgi:hypothetical protein